MAVDGQQAAVVLDPRKAETFAERIHYCREMLHLHEFLSGAENERVKARQVKRGVLPAASPLPAGNVVEMGDIVSVDRDPYSDSNTRTQYRRCLLIEFAAEDDVKRAIKAKRVEFTIFGE